MKPISFTNTINHIDLNLFCFGTQECEKGHSFGPAMKEHYKIHYIHKGRGVFKLGGSTYYLEQGQGFLICPGIIAYYAADENDPWVYSWITFNGIGSENYLERAGLTVDHPVLKYGLDAALEQCFKNMFAAANKSSRDLRLQSLICDFFALLIDHSEINRSKYRNTSVKSGYAAKVMEFIQIHYSDKVSISDLAHYVHLSKKYLSSLFKAETGSSIHQYLLNYRLDKACVMLADERLSIGDVSRSVGYEDPLLFSKMFKRIKGVSPRQYRSWNSL